MENTKEETVRHLCKGLEDYLCGTATRIFAHHLAHVAPEPWLILESAYLVNRLHGSILPGWHAIPEKAKIDITLQRDEDDQTIRLEFKLVETSNWKPAWDSVYNDLWRPAGSSKPRANASICFLLDGFKASPRRRESTRLEYRKRFNKLASLAANSSYPIHSRAGSKGSARAVFVGLEHEARWRDSAVSWCLIAFTR